MNILSPFSKAWRAEAVRFADQRVGDLVKVAKLGDGLALSAATRQALQAALPLAKGHAERLNLARIASLLRQGEVAEQVFRAALKETSRVESIQVGRLAARTGYPTVAAEAFQRALERSNTVSQALRLARLSHGSALPASAERGLGGATQLARQVGELEQVALRASDWGYAGAANRALSRAVELITRGGQ